MAVRTITLLDQVTTTGGGTARAAHNGRRSFQGKGSTTGGVGSADIRIEGSNDNTNWIEVAAITLTLGVAETSDGATLDNAWRYIRGRVQAISGTGAKVSLLMGD